MISNCEFLWASASTFGDSFANNDDSISRWDCEETPSFPLSLSSMMSPKLPKRQRTNESVKDDMLDLMIADEETIMMQDDSGNNNATIASLGTFSLQFSEATLSPIRCRSAPTKDCPIQSVAARRIPRRQFGSMVTAGGTGASSLINMRIQSLSRTRRAQSERQMQDVPSGHPILVSQPGSPSGP